MSAIENLNIKIYADGADLDGIREMSERPYIRGFTTNPTLMRKAGVDVYKDFALRAVELSKGRPVSFEVLSDDLHEMEKQASEIASWGPNVDVKIPVTNSLGEFTGPLLKRLSEEGVRLNITAVMTLEQIKDVSEALAADATAVISVFAGRIADTGRDPVPLMMEARSILSQNCSAELMWASPREVLNIFQADQIGCDIITVTNGLLQKLNLLGKDLGEFSLETVQMFVNDANQAGFSLALPDKKKRVA